MNLPKELTTVTSLSKYLAMVLFIALPIVGFFLGMRYQEIMDLAKSQEMESNLAIPRVPTPTPIAVPTIDPSITANWKTYRDKKYNFLFKYPDGWIAGDMSTCTDGQYGVYLRLRNNYCEPEMGILVTQKGDKNNCFPNSLRVLSRKDISVADLSAETIVIENPRSTGRNETIVGFEKDNYCYSINNRVHLVPEDTFNQILSTFKFTL